MNILLPCTHPKCNSNFGITLAKTTPAEKTPGKTTFQNTRSQGGEPLLLLDCRAKACREGLCFAQTLVVRKWEGGYMEGGNGQVLPNSKKRDANARQARGTLHEVWEHSHTHFCPPSPSRPSKDPPSLLPMFYPPLQ